MTKDFLVTNTISAVDELNYIPLWDRIIRNKWNQFAVTLAIMAVILPVMLIIFIYARNIPNSPHHPYPDTCNIKQSYRVPCGRPNITGQECITLQCCYIDQCYHRLPARHGYRWSANDEFYKSRQKLTPFGNPSKEQINITVEEMSGQRLKISFYDSKKVSVGTKLFPGIKLFNYTIYENDLGIIVNRTNGGINGTEIFSTIGGPLIASDGYWEIAVSLNSQLLFGFGDLLLKNGSKYVLYNNPNDLSRFPIVMANINNSYHGLRINTSGLLEVQVLESRMLILRCLTSEPIGFQFDLLIGEKPKDLTKQIRQLTRPNSNVMPTYRNLGVHICRNSVPTPNIENIFKDVEKFHTNAKTNKLPYESDCLHESLFSLVNNITNEERTKIGMFIKTKLKEKYQKEFMMHLPPHVAVDTLAYSDGIEKGLLYLDVNNCSLTLNSIYLNKNVSYPDYNHFDAIQWFEKYASEISGLEDVNGVILNADWPIYSNNLTVNLTESNLVYHDAQIEKSLTSTIPWNASTTCNATSTSQHLENHNKYGYYFLKAVNQLFLTKTNKNLTFTLSPSSYMDHTMTHRYGIINQNISISWLNMRKTLANSLFSSIFVDPVFFATPVCGSTEVFDDQIHADLCIRWYIMAVTFPLFYISSMEPHRDPFSLPTGFATKWTVAAVKQRYQLLPYINTVLRSAEDEPLLRPMFYDFPNNNNTFNLEGQYMVGKSLLAAQILIPDFVDFSIYLPAIENQNITNWYEFWNGQQYNITESFGKWIKIYPLLTDSIIYILGGNIIGTHKVITSGNADSLRSTNPLTISIALHCYDILVDYPVGHIVIDSRTQTFKYSTAKVRECSAVGEHIVSDENNLKITFKANETELQIDNLKEALSNVCQSELNNANTIDQLNVYGLDSSSFHVVNVDPPVNLCNYINNNSVIINYLGKVK